VLGPETEPAGEPGFLAPPRSRIFRTAARIPVSPVHAIWRRGPGSLSAHGGGPARRTQQHTLPRGETARLCASRRTSWPRPLTGQRPFHRRRAVARQHMPGHL